MRDRYSEPVFGPGALAKVSARILPLLFVLYFVNFLDRVNVGYAGLQMNGDLGFTKAVYGLGAGIFFLGYFLFEVPSNWIAVRTGAKAWLVRITLSWGVIATAMAFVRNPATFYILRFLLGVAEAGFVPVLLLYVAAWFPLAERANAVAKLWSSTAFALVLGGPLSALLLTFGGPLRGWQWMFLCEGIPAILLGFIVMRALPATPAQAAWFTAEERTGLQSVLDADAAAMGPHGISDFRTALTRPIVWGFSLTYLCLGVGFFGITFWLPQIVKELSGLTAVQTSLVSALPYLFAAAAMLIVGARRMSGSGYRFTFIAGTLIGAAGVLGCALTSNVWVSLTLLTIGAMGIWSVVAIFWAAASARLTGAGAAGGLALMNAIGGIGGFAGPYMIGLVSARTGTFAAALVVIAVVLVVCCVLASIVMGRAGGRAIASGVPA